MHFVSEARVRNQQVYEMTSDGGTPTGAVTYTLSATQIETLRLLLDAEASEERDRLGRYLPVLATIGSVSPLIGLFGTVLGVIQAFLGIATQGIWQPRRRRAGRGRGADRHRGGARRRHSGHVRLQHLCQPAQPVRRRSMESFGTAVIALLAREGRI